MSVERSLSATLNTAGVTNAPAEARGDRGLGPQGERLRVVILGLARQGVALARFFCSQGATVVVSDVAAAETLSVSISELAGLDVEWALGGHPLSLLEGCDLLCLSGGVPPQIPIVQEARRRGIALSNDAILTLDALAGSASPTQVSAVTGSSGKTTTTTLVGLMLRAAGYREPQPQLHRQRAGGQVWVGGNIGTPLVDRLDRILPDDAVVMELSSFQLELCDSEAGGQSISPPLAAVLNVTPNHLDRHPSMSHYTACKANILRWQSPGDIAVLGADDSVTGAWLRSGRVVVEAGAGQQPLSFTIPGRRLGFGLGAAYGDGCWLEGDDLVLRLDSRKRPVVAARQVTLRGRHNLLNMAAACTLAGALGVAPEAMASVAASFTGVPHRLEVVRDLGGVRWINDSIATTPERAAAALRSFDDAGKRSLILLAGGRDKKLPWQDLAALAQGRVRHVVTFGEAADLIGDAMGTPGASASAGAVAAAGPGPEITRCDDLEEAVAIAAKLARPGDVVLLSPGGTSFDAYQDFEARGRHFRDLVQALPEAQA